MKFGTIVLQVNAHRLMESDFRFDVTFSWQWPCHNFPQQSAAAWRVKMNHLPASMQQHPSVP